MKDNGKNTLDLKFYPTKINKSLNIDFAGNEFGLAQVNLFSESGAQVFSQSKNISTDEKLELNVGNLSKGIYICKVQLDNKIRTFKVIKI